MIVMAVFGIGGGIDRPAAIRARSQKFDPRLYPTVRRFYLQNVVSGNFHIRTSFGLHQQSLATVLQASPGTLRNSSEINGFRSPRHVRSLYLVLNIPSAPWGGQRPIRHCILLKAMRAVLSSPTDR